MSFTGKLIATDANAADELGSGCAVRSVNDAVSFAEKGASSAHVARVCTDGAAINAAVETMIAATDLNGDLRRGAACRQSARRACRGLGLKAKTLMPTAKAVIKLKVFSL